MEKQFVTWLLLIQKVLVASEVNIWQKEAMFMSHIYWLFKNLF